MRALTEIRLTESNIAVEPRRYVAAPRQRLSWVLSVLLLYLAAITIFGKGPAYIAVGPVYWGEVVLLTSLVWAALQWRSSVVRTPQSRALAVFIGAFLVLGATEAARDYSTWGIDTLRDSAVWYYSMFYFVGLVIASSNEQSRIFCSRWKLFFIASIPWAAAEVLTTYGLSKLTPMVPGRGVEVLSSAGLDIVQSMGLGCLLLVAERRQGWLAVGRTILATFGLIVTGIYYGRGAKLAVLVAITVMIAISTTQRSSRRNVWRRVALIALFLGTVAVIAVAMGTDLTNQLSLDRFKGASLENPDDTAAWRTVWWGRLYDAVIERNPILGLGFGENLAAYNPDISTQETEQFPVRSPHNFNMTVFARMGILGSALWAGVLYQGLLIPLWKAVSAPTNTAPEQARQRAFWIAVLFAIWVNGSFGVLLEGPVMGIPFWLVLGLVAGNPNPRRQTLTVHSTSTLVHGGWNTGTRD